MSELAPVVIAGAGPAGSVLALSLAKQNIPVLLLEREVTLPIDLRASTFHSPSLEMLDELGVETRYQCEVIGFVQDATGVDVVVQTPAGSETIRGSFLVGADGASSNVRKAAGIDYSGFTYDEKFLVVSTDLPFDDVFEQLSWVNYVADPQKWCVILRTDKQWRVLWPTDSNPDSDQDTGAMYLSDAFIQERLQHLWPKQGDYTIGHRTLYHVHQRVAESYYQGRVALVGDACHINNPLGGMGMNGGLHDAVNLAEKLTSIIKEGADVADRLAHYDRQRRELAVQFVQEHTINNKKLMESTDPDIQSKRQHELMETAEDPVRAKEFILERAMINCVRESLAVA